MVGTVDGRCERSGEGTVDEVYNGERTGDEVCKGEGTENKWCEGVRE